MSTKRAERVNAHIDRAWEVLAGLPSEERAVVLAHLLASQLHYSLEPDEHEPTLERFCAYVRKTIREQVIEDAGGMN